MARIFITYILPLLLPTLMYFAWTVWVRKQVQANRAKAKTEGLKHTEGDHTEAEDYDIKMPWFRLILTGVGLMLIGLVLSVFFSPKNEPGSTYRPPYEKNGTIVPGEYVTPKSN
ncbi:MAG: hypothetical protein JKY27_02925 [Magnetovibrio sp.]|nr:hypothetical protein [Magnetovibrio sp.]